MCGRVAGRAVAVRQDVPQRRPLPLIGQAQRYGRPREGVHAIQIEIDRGLYLDRARMVPTSNYAAVKRILDPLVAELAALPLRFGSALAAE